MQVTPRVRSFAGPGAVARAPIRGHWRLDLLASLLIVGGASTASAFAQPPPSAAIACETTVQSTYWQLRSDGKAGPFPIEKYREVLAQRAEKTARELEYVREARGRGLDVRELQAEITRMQRDTKAPDALKKLFAALGNDPQRIGECLAKPLLAERMSYDAFAHDAHAHAATRQQAENELIAMRGGGKALPATNDVRVVDLVSASDLQKALAAKPVVAMQTAPNDPRAHDPLALGMLLPPAKGKRVGSGIGWLRAFGAGAWMVKPDGAQAGSSRWSGLVETDTDYRALRGAYRNGKLELRVVRWPKRSFDDWWALTGRQFTPDYAPKATPQLRLGVTTQALIGQWQPTRRFDSYEIARNASTSDGSTVISTGTEMLIWGGLPYIPSFTGDPEDSATVTNAGAAYNPTTDSWRVMSSVGAPAPRRDTLSIWTGSEMLVQGGSGVSGSSAVYLNDGGLYDPVADKWQPIAKPPASWPADSYATVVWTGNKAIFYGGYSYTSAAVLNTGAIFDPSTGQWTAFSIASNQIGGAEPVRAGHSAVWTGSTMLVFGGYDALDGSCALSDTPGVVADHSFAFNPFTGVGEALPARPSSATGYIAFAPAFWTGSAALIYGGNDWTGLCSRSYVRTALKYDPTAKKWSALLKSGDPLPNQSSFTPVLIGGNQLVVWGGQATDGTTKRTGGIYNVDNDTWVPVNPTGALSARGNYLAAGVGSQMVLLDGNALAPGDIGARFNPLANTWAGLTQPPADGPPTQRRGEAFAGSSTDLIVWSGFTNGSPDTDGGIYDSVVDVWHPVNGSGAPSARYGALSAFTSSQFLVWGGVDNDPNITNNNPIGNGKQYDPIANAWSPIPAPPMSLTRDYAATIWDGSGLFVWGGYNSSNFTDYKTGARFVPATGLWTTLPSIGAPSARNSAVVASDGNGNTLIWGGSNLADATIYHASSGTWTPIPNSASFPSEASADANNYQAFWMGDRFGALAFRATPNAVYRLDDPTTGSWSKASAVGEPTTPDQYIKRTSIWTGRQLLIWGNYSSNANAQKGWFYKLATDTWSLPPSTNAPRAQTDLAMTRVGSMTAVYGGITADSSYYHASGSLYQEDTRTGTLSTDLVTTVNKTPAQPALGDLIQFTVNATNNGPDIATGVTLDFNLQTNLGYNSIAANTYGCTHPAANATGNVHCLIGSIPPNSTQSIVVRAQAFSATQATAVAAVAGNEPDPNSANNSATQQFTVLSVPPPPSLSIADVSIAEGNNGISVMTFTVSLSSAATTAVTFNIATANGTAAAGSDYVASSLTGQSIPAGQTSKTFAVTVNGDTVVEPDETFTVNLSNASGATVADGQAVGTVLNDDQPVLSIADVSLLEGNSGTSNATFKVSLDRPSISAVTYNIATADGTAMAGSDYTAKSLTGVTIPAGQTSVTFPVSILGDGKPEPNETFAVNVSNVSGATVARAQAIGTILNDDGVTPPGLPGLTITDVSQKEGNSASSQAVFAIALSASSASDVIFDIATADGSAFVTDNDYVSKSQTITIPAGQTAATFNVKVNGDTKIEPDEYFVVNISNLSNAIAANPQAIGTILNDDGPAVLSIANAAAVFEGDSGTTPATFTVSLSAPTSTPVTFDIATADGSATTSDTDYVARSLTGVTIPVGATSATFQVTINGDTKPETDETFLVNIADASGATIDPDRMRAMGTIKDDDTPPVLSIGNASMNEGNSGTHLQTFTISLSAPATKPISFDINTADGTAMVGDGDYIANSATGVTIPVGGTTATFGVTVNGDTKIEDDEQFTVNVSNIKNATTTSGAITNTAAAIGTIVNDDTPLLPTLSILDASIQEGDNGTQQLIFTVKLSKPSAKAVTYHIFTADGTAKTGSDYVGKSLVGETIPAGQSSKTFSVTINGDTTPEAKETFFVNLDTPINATIARGQATGTIDNDDGPVLSIADVSMAEGNSGTSTMTFTVKLAAASNTPVTYDIATADNSAKAGSDYVAKALTGQTIPAGQTSKTFTVTINGDTTPELDEAFLVNLSNVANATVSRTQATGTILDDDKPQLYIGDQGVVEGTGSLTAMIFNVKLLHGPSTQNVSFNVTSSNGTATAGEDYLSLKFAKPLVIPAGKTSINVVVTIFGDNRPEPDEFFFVKLSNPVNATIYQGQAIGTIFNDDQGVFFIGKVQGSGLTSPLLGQPVTVRAIVTALTHDGFFVQTPDAERDKDPATSEGLYVFTGTSPAVRVAVGNKVQVSGQVQEATIGHMPNQSTLTQIAASKVSVLASSVALPTPIVLGINDLSAKQSLAWLERYEGMRVSVPKLVVVGPTEGSPREAQGSAASNGVFYGVLSGTPRPFVEPGMDPLDHALMPVGVLPPVFDGNPERLRIDSKGQTGAHALSVDNGSTVDGLTGVLGYSSGAYTLLPDPGIKLQVHSTVPLRAVSMPLASDITIGSFNLRRFFDSTDASGNEPVLTKTAYAMRLAKTANAICAYARNPAILGVAEVKNLSTLSDLASAVNTNAGNVLFPGSCKGDPGYRAYVVSGNDAEGLNIGFLVSAAEVRPGLPRVEVMSVTQSGKSEQFTHRNGHVEPLNEHPPLVLRARVNRVNGQSVPMTVIATHLWPRDGINDAAPGSNGWATKGAYVRAKRAAQASYLAALIHARQAADSHERIIVLGDFNASEFSDGYVDVMGIVTGQQAQPEEVIEHTQSALKRPLTNMTLNMPKAERYTVTQAGNAQALDHILVNQSLVDGGDALHTEYARINADFGEDNIGDFSVPVRVSDHDPVVLYLSDPATRSSNPCRFGARQQCSSSSPPSH